MRTHSQTSRQAIAIRHVGFEDLGLIQPLLAQRGYAVHYLDVGIDPIMPDAVVPADLVIVLGGPIGVCESAEYPVLADEKEALAPRLDARLPTLGVCLGAQLIADSIGAKVSSTGRKEIGYAPLTLTAEGRDSVLAPIEGVPVLHWHGDEFDIPKGADRLASTPGFPNQAFSFGRRVLGLQFHLEADHTQIERWLIGHAAELAAAGISPSRIRRDAALFGPTLERTATHVIGDWLDHLY